MKRTLPVVVTGLLVVVTGSCWLSSPRTEPTPEPQPAYVAAEGTVEAMRGGEVEVGSQLTGRIARFLVDEGDVVEKGQVIAILDNDDTRAKLEEAGGELAAARSKLQEVASGSREEEIAQAAASLAARQAEVELAKADFERQQRLHQEGIVSASMLNEKERTYRVAVANVREAEERKRLLEKGVRPETLQLHQDLVTKASGAVEFYERLLEKSFVRAPIGGKVIRKNLEQGEVVYAEIPVPLVVVADVENTWINAEVDETDAGKVGVGDEVQVTADAYPGQAFRGRVAEIADYVGARNIRPNDPARNLAMKVVQVKIALLEKSPFRLGMSVDVRITLD